MRTRVYVDGFNLYYRLRGKTGVKWLDLSALCQSFFPPEHPVAHIRYFTARVSGTPRDPQASRRQHAYLRALNTLPNLTIHYGRFLTNSRMAALKRPIPGLPDVVEVIHTEEKGSDVNLGAYLLLHAFDGAYDQAAVLSNDSDVAEPIRIVRERFEVAVGVISPDSSTNGQLVKVASFVKNVNAFHLTGAQFPDPLVGPDGRAIAKPVSW